MNRHYRNLKSPWNPRVPVDITPGEFEQLVLDWLKASACKSGHRINAKHLGVVKGAGGDYKIDVLVTFTIFGGAQVTVFVECKHQHRPVERDDTLILEAKLRDVGAHKGMLFSTSGFQKGALEYAASKGIATITVISGKWLYETKGAIEEPVEPPSWVRLDKFAGIRVTPTGESISSHTITLEHTDTLVEWLMTLSEAIK